MNVTPHKQPSQRRARRRTEMLSDLGEAINSVRDLDRMLAMLLEVTAKETGAERTSLFLNDARTDELFTRSALGISSGEIRLPNDTGLVGHVFQGGESIIINDVYSDARFNASVDKVTGFTTRNILCVPVKMHNGEVIGAAQALNKINGHFTADDQAGLEAMATCAAMALHQAEFSERMNPPLIRVMNTFFRFIFGDRSQ